MYAYMYRCMCVCVFVHVCWCVCVVYMCVVYMCMRLRGQCTTRAVLEELKFDKDEDREKELNIVYYYLSNWNCSHYLQMWKKQYFNFDFNFNFQSHLAACRFDSVPCPHQCSAHLTRANLDDHLEYLCPRRRVVCDFCSQEFSGDYMDQVCALSAYSLLVCHLKRTRVLLL